jgi:ATP-dependent phosphofructokinase / diphosphate-dependent phosphofructokinase
VRIAISTSGGDAPGLNAVIRGATISAINRGHEIFGIRYGFNGLLVDDELIPLTEKEVDGIERRAGTILGAASKGSPFDKEGKTLGALEEALKRHEIDALIIVGGDGSMQIANLLAKSGLRVVGVPKTIDRDVVHTSTTFGFDSAVNVATEALDKLHLTAESHDRLMVVEVMGRDTGWIALHAGIAGGAHMIALPEFPYDVRVFADHILGREKKGYRYHIMVCAEGAKPIGQDDAQVHARTGRYGGVAEVLAAEIAELTGTDSRSISLGHLLRGGTPTTFDRQLGLRFGSAAVSALVRGEEGVMVAFRANTFHMVPIWAVAGKVNRVNDETPEFQTAQNFDICFGIPGQAETVRR